ncbi:MAG: hypothetical protein EBT18_09455 [Gammaproteobacteria bacterium]|nr:hypothetical protein [Gammaproteobacteria bacterium]
MSGAIYRGLRQLGLAPSSSTYHAARRKTIGRGSWREVKLALLDEIKAQRHSGNSVFASRLLKRIEKLPSNPPPLTAALLSGEAIASGNAVALTNDPALTESQHHALTRIVANPITFLMGAPGTGKTRVISKAVSHFLSQEESVLFCCNTRSALDHAASHLPKDSEGLSLKTVASVVGDNDGQAFDTVVIDEAGMASIAEVLILSTLARNRIVFVGDPMQLPPIASTDSPWLNQNIFQRVSQAATLSGLYVWQREQSDIALLLREQFDIPERIFSVLNHFCYAGRLSSRSKGKGHISFIDTSSLNATNKGKQASPTNPQHAAIVVEEIKRLISKSAVQPESIGVLTPFAAQAELLQSEAKKNDLPGEIAFGTVHTFQGRLKNCLILDITSTGVDYTYRNLADDDQALSLMNSALSRCRTVNNTEGRLVVIADLDHIQDKYRGSILLRILTRLYFRADVLKDEDSHKYSQTTNQLYEIFTRDWEEIDGALREKRSINEEAIKTLIYNACDLIPRLIILINRLRPGSFEAEHALTALEKPYAALALVDPSVDAQFDPERIDRFKSVVTDLYKIIYESTMKPVPGEHRNRGPEKPIYDPDADNGESYGRVRIWIRELRNYYQHDSEKPEDYRKEFSKRQRDFAFQAAIGRDAPEERAGSDHNADDYSAVEYLRVALHLLLETIRYLKSVKRVL